MNSERVYLIDDDTDCLTSLSFQLHACGYQCLAFSTAADFFAALSPGATGVLLTDHRLNDSNSLLIMRKLEEMGFRIPVVVLSGRVEAEVAEQIRESNAVGLLQKPTTSAELIKMINAAQLLEAT